MMPSSFKFQQNTQNDKDILYQNVKHIWRNIKRISEFVISKIS